MPSKRKIPWEEGFLWGALYSEKMGFGNLLGEVSETYSSSEKGLIYRKKRWENHRYNTTVILPGRLTVVYIYYRYSPRVFNSSIFT